MHYPIINRLYALPKYINIISLSNELHVTRITNTNLCFILLYRSLSLSLSFSHLLLRLETETVSTDTSRFPQPSTERNARNKILSRDKHTQTDLGQAVYIVGMRCRRGWTASSQAAERLQAAIMSQLVNRETLFWTLQNRRYFALYLVRKLPSPNVIRIWYYIVDSRDKMIIPTVGMSLEIKIITIRDEI